MKRYRAGLALFCAIVLVVESSCSRYAKVPQSEWNEVDSAAAKTWKVKTATMKYKAQRLMVTDSTVVLLEASLVQRLPTADDAGSIRRLKQSDLPIVIPRDEVVSISRSEFSWGLTTIGIVAGVGLVGFAAFIWFVSELAKGMNGL